MTTILVLLYLIMMAMVVLYFYARFRIATVRERRAAEQLELQRIRNAPARWEMASSVSSPATQIHR